MHIFDELKERGLIFQTTDEDALRKALEEGQVSYYTGYDPTADSLHLGHLVAILTSVAYNWRPQTLCACRWCDRTHWRPFFQRCRAQFTN